MAYQTRAAPENADSPSETRPKSHRCGRPFFRSETEGSPPLFEPAYPAAERDPSPRKSKRLLCTPREANGAGQLLQSILRPVLLCNTGVEPDSRFLHGRDKCSRKAHRRRCSPSASNVSPNRCPQDPEVSHQTYTDSRDRAELPSSRCSQRNPVA